MMPAEWPGHATLDQWWSQLDHPGGLLLVATLLLGVLVGWIAASLRKQSQLDRLTAKLETERRAQKGASI